MLMFLKLTLKWCFFRVLWGLGRIGILVFRYLALCCVYYRGYFSKNFTNNIHTTVVGIGFLGYDVSIMSEQKKILTIETSGQIGSVAVGLGDEILAEGCFSGIMKHTTELLPTIERLISEVGFKPAELDHVYVSAGPGSFTGLRLAVTTAKTLAYASNCRIVAVPSIEAQVLNAEAAIADGISGIENVAVVLQAGRGMVFGGVYQKSDEAGSFVPGYRVVSDAAMVNVEELIENAPKPLYMLGLGIKYYTDKLESSDAILLDEKYWSPQVSFVHRCGQLRAAAGLFVGEDAYDDAVKFEPVYMRRPEAEVKWEELGR